MFTYFAVLSNSVFLDNGNPRVVCPKQCGAYEVNATKDLQNVHFLYIYHGDRTFAIVRRRKKKHYLPLKRKPKLRWGAYLMGNTHLYILIVKTQL